MNRLTKVATCLTLTALALFLATVTAQAKETAHKPKCRFLGIGISVYKEKKVNPLPQAQKDVADIAAVFQDQEGKLFASVDSTLLVNEDATRQAIEDGLDGLDDDQLVRGDYAVVAASSHGFVYNKKWYFVPHDAKANRIDSLVPGDAFATRLDRLAKRGVNVVLLLDACFAGAIGNSPAGKVEDVAQNAGVIVFAACLPGQGSYESPRWGHGAFTKALLEALDGKADYNHDGTVTLAEVELYVSTRVEELTKDSPEGVQRPTTNHPMSVPNSLPLARVAKLDDSEKPAKPAKPERPEVKSGSVVGIWTVKGTMADGTESVLTLSLLADGRFTMADSASGKKLSGKYTYEDGVLTLTAKGKEPLEMQVVSVNRTRLVVETDEGKTVWTRKAK